MKIKLCGLTRMEDIETVNQYLPDYIGFVFAESRRRVDRKHALKMKEKLHPSIQSVGVFVNEESSTIISLCKEQVIDIIQLHGEEGEEEIQILRKAVKNPIIKAVRVKDLFTIEAVKDTSADYLLLDAYHPNQYGGSGHTFDWNLLYSLTSTLKKPFFLAGGIHSGNIEEAVKEGKAGLMPPFALDISSGIETDGYKDPEKIKEVMEKIRRIEE